MRRLTAALATAALTLTTTVLVATPAHALAEPVTAKDGINDVYLSDSKEVSRQDKLSIDVRKVQVRQVDKKVVRFSATIRQIVRSPDFDQIVYFTLSPAKDSEADWTGSLGFTTKGKNGYASYGSVSGAEDTESCRPLKVTVSVKRGKFSADVPARCVPTEPARVLAQTVVGHFQTGIELISADKAPVQGLHTLRD